MEKLVKKIKVITELKIITGIHIGGSGDNVEIGGIDNPVIKLATRNNQPYIPGSSIKGKLRSLLEQIDGASDIGHSPKVNSLFGYAAKEQPSKLIVRDAYLTKESIELLENTDSLDMPYTENKYENTIDRIKGATKRGGLRNSERVPAGVKFDVNFVINVWDTDGDGYELINLLQKGIVALENDYLGGSGSRGYGQVKFGELKQEVIDFKDYLKAE
jgi:CRISPR-associated protein Csm3